MTPETDYCLAKAGKLLEEADAMLGIGLSNAAGRTAYMSAFHAAQAIIFNKTGKIAKTHAGVHSELHRVMKGDPRFSGDLKTFLSQAYNLKAIADYETGPDADVPVQEAELAVAGARRFLDHVSLWLNT